MKKKKQSPEKEMLIVDDTTRSKHAVNDGCSWGNLNSEGKVISDCHCLISVNGIASKLCASCNRRIIADKESSSKLCIECEHRPATSVQVLREKIAREERLNYGRGY